jgi:uncharacterized membrane protein
LTDFVHPNLHAIIVHYPLALLTLGVAGETFCTFFRHYSIRMAARWAILIGTVFCVPTATSGIYALYHAAAISAGADASQTWAEVTASAGWKELQWTFMSRHVWLTCGAAVLFLMICTTWLAASDERRERMHTPLLLGMLFGVGLVIAGAWHAGEAVYYMGTAVVPADKADLASIYKPTMEGLIMPLQQHVILAGMIVSLSVLGIGASIRAINDHNEDSSASPSLKTHHPDGAMPGVISIPEKHVIHLPHEMPAGALWGIAALLAGGTIFLGLWGADLLKPAEILSVLRGEARARAHMLLGVATIILLLTIATIVHRFPKRKGSLAVTSLLLIVVLAAQFWVGILMVYDTGEGPVTRFNAPGDEAKPAVSSVEH